MINQNNDKSNKMDRFRGLVHIIMGIMYLFVAAVVVYADKNGFINIGTTFSYIIAFLMLAYGGFRIFRGYKRLKGDQQGW